MSRDRVTLDAVSPVLDLVGDWFALGLTEMMVRISCPCGHVGVVCAESLPRDLTCSLCGSSRHVDAGGGKAITSTARFEEWLSGERPRPRVQAR
jgi:hypothetical protein